MAFTQGISSSKPLLRAPLDETTRYQRAIERAFSRQQFAYHSPQKMSDLLLQYRGLASSDPRDNVYAFLSLASNMSTSKFLPDYSKPTNKVYKHLTKEVVKRHKDLTIICASQPPSTSEDPLPSWTPDWSSPWTSFYLLKHHIMLWLINSQRHSVAVIENLSATYEASGPVLVDWLKRVRSWRTLIGNWDRGSRPFAFDDFRQTFAQHVLGSEPSYPVNLSSQAPKSAKKRSKKDVMRFQAHMNIMCWKRKHAKMRRQGREEPAPMNMKWNMREGLVPSHAVPGDEVCVLYGCKVPVILRKSGAKDWVLVGDAYLDGYMNGEIFSGYSQSHYAQVFSIQ